jgi:magnesium-transporting ATPase (P-type)
MKDDKLGGRPFAFKGTIVTDGEGKMLVCSVGTNTNEGLNQLQSNLKKVNDDGEDEDEEKDDGPKNTPL